MTSWNGRPGYICILLSIHLAIPRTLDTISPPPNQPTQNPQKSLTMANNTTPESKTYKQQAGEFYNRQYDNWVPWLEDQYLKYFTKDNKTSYATKRMPPLPPPYPPPTNPPRKPRQNKNNRRLASRQPARRRPRPRVGPSGAGRDCATGW